ncbi:hypothetical protein EJ04DRAFT_521872 [Polyplosphaeria fusca]|uniref:SWIRM domain-containing protein n=1 Tax=Polyplosphaeria fusca TaxID=682080 RepID=A0A9P4R443_9PLEO|nr:hypothetical protein EJ04DRAFT_521872 [Polyplosphaeria fusca]
MYSTFAASTDADALEESAYLFNQSQHEFLSVPLSHENEHPKPHAPATVAMSGLNGLMYGQYSESSSSSIQYGDTSSESQSRTSKAGFILQKPLPYVKTETISTQEFMAGSPGIFSYDSKPSSTPELPQISEATSGTHRSSTDPVKRKTIDFRANSSIPAALSWEEFARQSILAAESSRLNPFSLHPEEYKLLREHITHAQVTVYLNIRNAILRLWTKNPLVCVTLEEASGCARDKRYFGLAKVAYHWLLRNGYINYGCVEVPNTTGIAARAKAKTSRSKTILVIGAGMSGLGCARHLEGLFTQLGEQWVSRGEQPPQVIVLEGRPRVGGRVYSHPLRNQSGSNIPLGHRCTAEMGAQIVTGFEHGNPLNAIIRGQLAIPYHGLRDNTILYDHDGTIVDKSQDTLVEKLYNDILERASIYRNKPATFRTVEGDRNLILFGRDPSDSGGATISTLESSNTPLPANASTSASTTEEKPSSGVEKLAGRAYQLTAGFNPNISAVEAAMTMGWNLKYGSTTDRTLDLNSFAKSTDYPTLGQTMDDGIRQYQEILELKPRDLRLLNWHHANLEYANAANVNQLSLSGWDQDLGNEFEGEHTQIIGGYQQVPRGLWQCPGKLDIRFKTAVKSIQYNTDESHNGKAVRVLCTNGEVFDADQIVLTTPLGVLKSGSITFQPPLPDWKQGVIERMGFGLLNKVILVYEKAFWEPDRDMFGLLNEAEHRASLDQKDYASRRGRCYLFWNCIKTSGRPTLVALMAGDAAHYAEERSNDDLVKEVTGRLLRMFAPKIVPLPTETIVTRWRRDPFACGSYSYVGPKTQAGDYDVMAKSHGPLHFAGEATCGTHPATVHGAYLSGLRAAAEVVESMIGPIKITSPLVEKKVKLEHAPQTTPNGSRPDMKRAAGPGDSNLGTYSGDGSQRENPNSQRLRDEDYEARIIGAILTEIGERPIKPGRAGVNPFLLYTKDFWPICKKECDEARKAATGDVNAKASKTDVRTAVGLRWRMATDEVKKPYLDVTQRARDEAAAYAASYKDRVATWDKKAERIRHEFIQNNPPPGGNEELLNSRTAIEMGTGKRLRRT